MSKKGPFSTRPPSKCSKQEFYWRGGDILKEQEYLSQELKKLFLDKQKSEEDLDSAERELANTRNLLKEREGFTNALAGFLENDTDSAFEEIKLKKELSELEQRIADSEIELEQYTSKMFPNVYSSLNKERAYFLLETQKDSKSLRNTISAADENRNNLSLVMTSQRYRKGLNLEFSLDKGLKKRNYLRSMVNRAKSENDRVVSPRNLSQTKESKELRKVFNEGIDSFLAKGISEEKLSRHPIKYKAQLEFLIKQIEDLNDRMDDVGCTDGYVDVASLKEKIFDTQAQMQDNEQTMSAETNHSTDFATIDDIKSPARSPIHSQLNSPKGSPSKNTQQSPNSSTKGNSMSMSPI